MKPKMSSAARAVRWLSTMPKHVDRAEIVREKGTNRSRFFRGQVDKYSWVDIGSSYLPSDILAAFLYAQLEKYEADSQRTRQPHLDILLHGTWTASLGLREWDVQLAASYLPSLYEQSYHMFYLIMPSLEARQAIHRGD
jgi:dTDP-4-amino-4,6-dideoxygalactose transaminase